jgi:hypothetical protein
LLLKRREAETPDPLGDFDPSTAIDWVWISEVNLKYAGE